MMETGHISKTQKQAAKLTEQINQIKGSKSPVISTYRISDSSVQAELRLRAEWTISLPVDIINYPKDLNPDHPNSQLWDRMRGLAWEITRSSALSALSIPATAYMGSRKTTIRINERTKTGPEKRAEAKLLWMIEVGNQFLADYRAKTGKKYLAGLRKNITDLQAQQKALIPKLRESNSQYLADRKTKSQEQARKNAEALQSGRFWEADKETLKNYFHPPFARNYLADVSAKWRAALYTEMGSTAYKGYSGDWRHKNIGSGNGYLCGIDDNGDEWGHRVDLTGYLDHDQYGDYGYADVTVEDAMAELFGVSKDKLDKCVRQGDLLFCATTLRKQPWETDTCSNCGNPRAAHGAYGYTDCNSFVPKMGVPVEMQAHEGPYQIRESHEVLSTGLRVNGGQYFASQKPIYVRHTSHAMVTLPAGEYRLYELQLADAD